MNKTFPKIPFVFFATCILFVANISTAKDFIHDPKFLYGFALSPLNPALVQQGGGFATTNTDTLRFRHHLSEPPFWQVAQWYSHFDLAKSPRSRTKYGFTHTNIGKSISVSRHHILTLEIKTDKEYSTPRTTENWPHLLIQHDFATPINLSELSSLRLSFSLRLLYCKNCMSADSYNSSLHTIQSPFYLMLRNDNPRSLDYGSLLWFGVPSFDYRDRQLPASPIVSWDIGTATYIYQAPPRAIWGDILFTDHQWHTAQVDVLTMIQQAIIDLNKQNLFKNTTVKDLEITHLNFGWESPGTFNAAIQIRNISLKYLSAIPSEK